MASHHLDPAPCLASPPTILLLTILAQDCPETPAPPVPATLFSRWISCLAPNLLRGSVPVTPSQTLSDSLVENCKPSQFWNFLSSHPHCGFLFSVALSIFKYNHHFSSSLTVSTAHQNISSESRDFVCFNA